MKLFVFGKTGQVARELILQGSAHEITALGRDQADLSDPAACAAIVAQSDADAVINAAAYTAVDKAEEEEALATIINGDTPGAMARACAAKDIPFLHVSTDYVFDGTGETPWSPSDPVAPQNAYGRSKLAGEEAVRAAGGAHLILRTSWVFSAHGNNFVKTMLRLSETRDHLTVVADQIGGPTAARDIAKTLLAIAPQLGARKGGTYHFAGQPPVSWADFARVIFVKSGRKMQVADIPTSDYPTPAKRPLNSRMDCADLTTDFGVTIPDWRASLDEVLRDLEA
ncbi:dTDP-4-dehydrorhamnose reductase [Cognatishimia activa]|uniref:dTDP-4-dehydrorhamnose reductase n=1 Tax=Cognatishimia activa TaxID=1715691 RepID=A0A975EN50_9RHOB|nr:dTDP-4-dehydrorhamnose reductase [Cognatishimia activa]QTN35198.1 dTDP-4-dehydrorhamnose reductase [Cognatishimia activa]